MTKSYENFDRPYRRGLVLGLSLAELFLILLFLLLLIAVFVVQDGNQAKEKLAKNEAALEKYREMLKGPDGKPISPEEFAELIDANYENQKLQELIDNLKPINERMKTLDEAIENSNYTEEEKKQLREDLVELIEKTEKIDELFEKIEMALAHDPNDEERKDILDVISALKKEDYSQQQIEKLFDLLKSGISEFEPDDLLNKLAFLKGGGVIPCWFVKQDSKTKPRKEVKIFDLLMNDNELIVVRTSLKDHENNPNFDQGNLSFLPKWPINKNEKKVFSYKKFSNNFQNYKKVGENKIQKDYICRFYVNIWDETSNKSFYKRNLRTIENIFYKFENNDKWPH